jgi:hypothetical protein
MAKVGSTLGLCGSCSDMSNLLFFGRHVQAAKARASEQAGDKGQALHEIALRQSPRLLTESMGPFKTASLHPMRRSLDFSD